MRNFIYLAFLLAACSKSSASQPPASKTAEPKAAEAPAVAAPAATPTAPKAGACSDDRRVTLSQWDFESHLSTIEMFCKDGSLTEVLEQDDLGLEPITMKVPVEAWDTLWKDFDSAKWREISSKCAKGRGAQSKTLSTFEEQGIAKVGIEISDGTTTKSFVCPGTKVTADQVALVDAMVTITPAIMKAN